ncbi:MAG TPA: primosomal protein N' [Xanthomonadales bacterium]|nr:primosomal protein N' [Xanthomonadales bacterium]
MTKANIWKIALPVPLPTLFDYLPPEDGADGEPGARVLVKFGQRTLVGILVAYAKSSSVPQDRLSRVIKLPDDGMPLLDQVTLDLLTWCSGYYKHAIGEVVLSALPPSLRKPGNSLPPALLEYSITSAGLERLDGGSRAAPVQLALLKALADDAKTPEQLAETGGTWRPALKRLLELQQVQESAASPIRAAPAEGPRLTDEQEQAVTSVRSEQQGFHCHLLDGVTGSGKTEIYMCLLEEVLGGGKQAMVLVPEIGLTPQLLQRFRRRLGLEPAVIHSRMSAGQRLRAWNETRTGHAPLLIGTRSALFTPMPRPGIIILDEEHDASFRQQDGFRYSARDVAVKRAAMLGVPIVLGSATPSLESIRNADEGRYRISRLRKRATRAPMPQWRLLDLKQQPLQQGITESALAAAQTVLDRGEQVMVFLNRRGYAPVLMCEQCGWQADCQRCDAHMTWHRGAAVLCCHHCGSKTGVPHLCPDCRADALEGIGHGTQQLEEMLEKRFDDCPVLRFDLDQTSRKGMLDEQIERVREGNPCILVGTQMLAKGHHFPKVTLVIVVGVDQALYSADYRALERMGQLLEQVAGRAGRAEKPGTVILQTLHPEHEALQLLITEGYAGYSKWLLSDRRASGLPPFSQMALLRADAHQKPEVVEFLDAAARCFPDGPSSLLGPLPAMMERRGGRIRMYLAVTADKRATLHRQLDAWLPAIRKLPDARKVRWAMDVDPQEL